MARIPKIPGLRSWTRVKGGPGKRPGYHYKMNVHPYLHLYIFPHPNRASEGPIQSYYVTDGMATIAKGCKTKTDCVKAVRAHLRAKMSNPLSSGEAAEIEDRVGAHRYQERRYRGRKMLESASHHRGAAEALSHVTEDFGPEGLPSKRGDRIRTEHLGPGRSVIGNPLTAREQGQVRVRAAQAAHKARGVPGRVHQARHIGQAEAYAEIADDFGPEEPREVHGEELQEIRGLPRRNPDPYGMPSAVVPAYGRDYRSKQAAIADWESGKDFQIADFHHPHDGRYITVNDFPQGWRGNLQIRYARLTKVAIWKGGTHRSNPTSTWDNVRQVIRNLRPKVASLGFASYDEDPFNPQFYFHNHDRTQTVVIDAQGPQIQFGLWDSAQDRNIIPFTTDMASFLRSVSLFQRGGARRPNPEVVEAPRKVNPLNQKETAEVRHSANKWSEISLKAHMEGEQSRSDWAEGISDGHGMVADRYGRKPRSSGYKWNPSHKPKLKRGYFALVVAAKRDPYAPSGGEYVKATTLHGRTMNELVEKQRAWVAKNNVGGTSYMAGQSGGIYTDKGHEIGYMSYNGRIWEGYGDIHKEIGEHAKARTHAETVESWPEYRKKRKGGRKRKNPVSVKDSKANYTHRSIRPEKQFVEFRYAPAAHTDPDDLKQALKKIGKRQLPAGAKILVGKFKQSVTRGRPKGKRVKYLAWGIKSILLPKKGKKGKSKRNPLTDRESAAELRRAAGASRVAKRLKKPQGKAFAAGMARGTRQTVQRRGSKRAAAAATKAILKGATRRSNRVQMCEHTIGLERGSKGRLLVCYPQGVFTSLKQAVVNIQKELRSRFGQLKKSPRVTRAEWKFSDQAQTKGRWHFKSNGRAR